MAVVPETRGGREALTEFSALEFLDEHTVVEARLLTGRTHQIRVHFAYIGHPLVGDPVYGRRRQRTPCPRQFLHAHRLAFRSPSTDATMDFTSALPGDLQAVLGRLRGS